MVFISLFSFTNFLFRFFCMFTSKMRITHFLYCFFGVIFSIHIMFLSFC